MNEMEKGILEGIEPTFTRVLALLSLCEEVCDEEGIPMKTMPKELFLSLKPTGGFASKSDQLYRSHVRELLQRYRDGKRLDLGTDAEVLLVLVETSLKSPLRRVGTALYHRCFHSVFGEVVYDDIFGGEPLPDTNLFGLDALELEARHEIAKTSDRPGIVK